MSNILRPSKLQEFIGKNEIKSNLDVYIKSAIKKHTSLDHILLCGLPGTGKTSLAMVIANELNAKIKIVQGGTLQKPSDIINLALTMNEHDVLFIDEIHSINEQCIELLYSIMEDFAIDISLGKDFNSKVTRLKVPNFTLIGATTVLYKIPQPLEDRFGIKIYLGHYSNEEMFQIAKQTSNKLNLNLSDKEIEIVANNAKGVPRIVNNLLKRIYDFKLIKPNIPINNILKKIGIISKGIDQNDIEYLFSLSKSDKPIGIKTISQMTNIDPLTIELKIEPYLLRLKYVMKNNLGRSITNEGLIFLKKILKNNKKIAKY